jgi:8-oxo-dGTP pyrophosphatase MutT (NUDIX family)/NTP pyrophosphatase (non-canonical NTP hydrolase)
MGAIAKTAAYVVLKDEDKIALVLRSNTGYRDGEWSLPAGRVEPGETFAQAALRELKEEAGVTASPADIRQICSSHRKSDSAADEAWVDVFFVCENWQGTAVNAEPEKHSELRWFDIDDLPEKFIDYQHAPVVAWHAGDTHYVEFGWQHVEPSQNNRMSFREYQQQAISTDAYGGVGDILSVAFINKVFGLAGESGEVVDKIKKLHRNQDGVMNEHDKSEIIKELGDVLWYLSAIAHYLNVPLDEVAQRNLDKLFDRKARGVIKSMGDNR